MPKVRYFKDQKYPYRFRMFNGKKFKCHGYYYDFPYAKRTAKYLRENGWLVRLTKGRQTKGMGKRKVNVLVLWKRQKTRSRR